MSSISFPLTFQLPTGAAIGFPNNYAVVDGVIVGRQGNPSFVLDGRATIVPYWTKGSPTPTYTRATTATVTDFEGRLVTVPSGAARFQGARFVYNLFAVNTVNNNGGSCAFASNVLTISTTGAGQFPSIQTSTLTLVAGQKLRLSFLVSSVSGSFGNSMNSTAGAATVTSDTPTLWSAGVAGTRYSVLTTCTVGGSFAYTIGSQNGVSTGAGAATITNIQIEEVTGQSNQNPSEYVSVGVLSDPYHGAGIDGCKYFTTENGNTVASNIVSEATGAAIADATLKGYLSEGAGTQILATADIRDMTTVGWTLGATMTRARTSVGIDGASNTATRLTGGAVAATNIITTAIVAAATSRTYSAYVKRVTGTGIVRISQDNFATNTDITSQLVNGSWVLIQLNQTQLNAIMGFKIDTSTDAIDVDCNQFESGAFATSRMLATGAARNADVLTFASAGNVSGTVGTVYAEVGINAFSGNHTLIGSDVAPMRVLYTDGDQRINAYTGTVGSTAVVAPTYVNAISKVAVKWSSSILDTYKSGADTGGTAPVSGDGRMQFTSAIGIGHYQSTEFLYGTIRNIRIYNRDLSAAQLAAMTT